MNSSIQLHNNSICESSNFLSLSTEQLMRSEDLETVIHLCEYFLRNSSLGIDSKKTVLTLAIKASNSLKQFRGGVL